MSSSTVVVLQYIGESVEVCGHVAIQNGDVCLLAAATEDGSQVMVQLMDGTYFGMHQTQDYVIADVLPLPTQFTE